MPKTIIKTSMTMTLPAMTPCRYSSRPKGPDSSGTIQATTYIPPGQDLLETWKPELPAIQRPRDSRPTHRARLPDQRRFRRCRTPALPRPVSKRYFPHRNRCRFAGQRGPRKRKSVSVQFSRLTVKFCSSEARNETDC
jgi:hypothetical protein